MTDLVFIRGKHPFTNSLQIAEGVSLGHKRVIALVRKYKDDFEEFGTLTFETSKSGGLPTEFAVLNED